MFLLVLTLPWLWWSGDSQQSGGELCGVHCCYLSVVLVVLVVWGTAPAADEVLVLCPSDYDGLSPEMA